METELEMETHRSGHLQAPAVTCVQQTAHSFLVKLSVFTVILNNFKAAGYYVSCLCLRGVA